MGNPLRIATSNPISNGALNKSIDRTPNSQMWTVDAMRLRCSQIFQQTIRLLRLVIYVAHTNMYWYMYSPLHRKLDYDCGRVGFWRPESELYQFVNKSNSDLIFIGSLRLRKKKRRSNEKRNRLECLAVDEEGKSL